MLGGWGTGNETRKMKMSVNPRKWDGMKEISMSYVIIIITAIRNTVLRCWQERGLNSTGRLKVPPAPVPCPSSSSEPTMFPPQFYNSLTWVPQKVITLKLNGQETNGTFHFFSVWGKAKGRSSDHFLGHGPIMAANLMDHWRDINGEGGDSLREKSIKTQLNDDQITMMWCANIFQFSEPEVSLGPKTTGSQHHLLTQELTIAQVFLIECY